MSGKSKFSAELALRTEFGSLIGDTRIRLLEEIGRQGSISKAAKKIPLSYKSAWDAVDEMNNLAEHALVDRTIGGAQGGGTQLTAYGQQLIALFRAVEGESQMAADRLSSMAGDRLPVDPATIRQLLRRMAVRTSARNQFACTVLEIRMGEVNARVLLALDDEQRLEAVVTCDSVARLGLLRGQEVLALVKAPAALVLPGWAMRTSAGNHLHGAVSRIHEGPVSSELVINLAQTPVRHVCAVVTTDALRELKLAVATQVTVAFQSSSVMLAVVN